MTLNEFLELIDDESIIKVFTMDYPEAVHYDKNANSIIENANTLTVFNVSANDNIITIYVY